MTTQVAAALALDKRTIGQLISLFENSRAEAREQRRQVLAELGADPGRRDAVFVGVAGTPGAGKSTLIGELALRLIQRGADLRVAVLAVDPTSERSGGALLGDRTRVQFPADEPRLFFRSQASALELGGLGRATHQVCRLLGHLFDVVLIETVGVGQSEIEIRHLADVTYLVLQPLGGDQIQFMKAGIMEIPDAFVLNKCDQREAARATYLALRGAANLVANGTAGAAPPPVFQTSATTGEGVDELATDLLDRARANRRDRAAREQHFFEKWVRDEYGRNGLTFLRDRLGGAAALWRSAGEFEPAQSEFERAYAGNVAGL